MFNLDQFNLDLKNIFSSIKKTQIKIINRLHYLNENKLNKNDFLEQIENIREDAKITDERIFQIPDSIELNGDISGKVLFDGTHEISANTKLNFESLKDFQLNWLNISGKTENINNIELGNYITSSYFSSISR